MPRKAKPALSYEQRVNLFTVDCYDRRNCWKRRCMSAGEDKGSFTQGVGYTKYHATPRPVCTTRHLHGCPADCDSPENVDLEGVRCCFRPEYRHKLGAPVGWLTCNTCGAVAPKHAAVELNTLPARKGIACKHEHVTQEGVLLNGWFECPDVLYTGDQIQVLHTGFCKGIWDHKPKPFEVSQYTWDQYMTELERRVSLVGK